MPPCKDEQRSQRALQTCNRVRSALAKVVNLKKEKESHWKQRLRTNYKRSTAASRLAAQ